jgi:thymidylate synthase ThyX
MPIKAEIILDSVSPNGNRITSFCLTYPRFIHAEVMTHRITSKNCASSRAIPFNKMVEDILKEPASFVWWGKNQPGMQAREELSPENIEVCKKIWLEALDDSIKHANKLAALGLHKQNVNRLLEPWFHMRTILTATELENMLNLRRHKDAQPEFHALADCIYDTMQNSKPNLLNVGEWHLPYIREEEKSLDIELLKKISTARCCRVSYMNHDGSVSPVEKDISLHDTLISGGHMSPLEHAAQCMNDNMFYGNFKGFKQYRKFIPNEDIFKG